MTIWVNTGKQHSNENRVYHTDLTCQYVTPMSLTAEEAPVDIAELDECSWCSDDWEQSQTQGRDCPFCGESVKKLPDHLPCEESP